MPYPSTQSAVFGKKGVLNLYRIERARVNTTAVDGLSSLNACIANVILFTSNPGVESLRWLWMIRYILCVERLQSMETKSPEQKLHNALFGQISDTDKMQNAISELNSAIIALHNPKITKGIAMDAVRSIQIAKLILSEIAISNQSVKNTVITK